MPTKSLFEQEAPEIGTQKCSTKRGVRKPLHAEFALNNRELLKAEVLEKKVLGHPQNCAFSLRASEMGGSGSSERDLFCTPTDVQCMSPFSYHFL